MAEYLIVSDSVSPIADGEAAFAVAGLAKALVAIKHRVTVLSLAAPDQLARVPGLARRLRTVSAQSGSQTFELSLFEGTLAGGQAHLYALGAAPANRGEVAAILASAAESLARDGLLKPRVVIGWGDTAAASLSAVGAAFRLFVLPAGVTGPTLTATERAALGTHAALEVLSVNTLTALGAVGAEAVIVPSPSLLPSLERDPALAGRASDQPLIAARFGCDEAPYDPVSDPALAVHFGPESPAGKIECRRAAARKTSLALGPRTLFLVTAPLTADEGGKAALDALANLARLDVAIAVPASGDRALTDRAAVLGIEHPGKIAVVPDAANDRALLAAADALLITTSHDPTGRAAGIALRYGVLPLAPDHGANGDFLVDYDTASATGSALLYSNIDSFEIEGAVKRALALKGNAEGWQTLVKALMLSAPRWSATATMLDALAPPEEATPVAAVA